MNNPRYQELSTLFLENLEFLKSVKDITISRASNTFYEEITRDEANAIGVSPGLVILGAVNLNRHNPIKMDRFIQSPTIAGYHQGAG